MRLSGAERDPGLLGSAQSSTVMQACQEVPCSRRGLALLVVPALSSQCGTFSKPEFSNKPSPGCVPRVKPQYRTATGGRRGLVQVCPDLLGSLADETRGETEQVADGNLQTGRDAHPVGSHVPKEESGRRAISCPVQAWQWAHQQPD